MKTYKEIRDNHTKKVNDLIEESKGFFAFSDEQMKEGMEKINITDKKELVSLSLGMILPRANVKKYIQGMRDVRAENNKALKEASKETKNQAILYELKNYECFYTGDIEDVTNFFKNIYSEDEILTVYDKYKSQEEDCF